MKDGSYTRIARYYDLMDWPFEIKLYSKMRREWIGKLRDEEILEIGVGTGKNLPYYHPTNRVLAIDRNSAMLKIAKHRKLKTGLKNIELVYVKDTPWQIPRRTFSVVVATFVLCTMDNPTSLITELNKFAGTGTVLILFEYTRPAKGRLFKVMKAINPLTKILFGVDFTRKPSALYFDDSWTLIEISEIIDDLIKVVVMRRN